MASRRKFSDEYKREAVRLVSEFWARQLDNVTPADVYFGRQYAVLTERSKIKRRTMQRRKKEYLALKAA